MCDGKKIVNTKETNGISPWEKDWRLAIVDGYTLLVEAGPDSHCGLRYPRAGWEVCNFLIEKLCGRVRANNCRNKKNTLILTFGL